MFVYCVRLNSIYYYYNYAYFFGSRVDKTHTVFKELHLKMQFFCVFNF